MIYRVFIVTVDQILNSFSKQSKFEIILLLVKVKNWTITNQNQLKYKEKLTVFKMSDMTYELYLNILHLGEKRENEHIFFNQSINGK